MIDDRTARQYYEAAESGHDFDHVLRVKALAERIARVEGGDLEVVRAAALLHDLGRPEQRATGRDHAVVSAERAREILAHHSAETVEAVAHAIAAHRFRTGPTPTTPEARALFDADKLDAIGAIGIARVFAYAGARDQPLWASMETVKLDGPDTSQHTPVHEFVFKLARLRDVLVTDTGRAIADERHRFMEEFFRRLTAEVQGEQ
ncbi:MAG: HD domain-containing protein [Anaerolineae bacterium]|jgi:uncharacterized protein